MSIIITTEATADYPNDLLKDGLQIIPMGYSVNGVAYDGETTVLSPKEFYDAVRQAKTKEDLPLTTMVTSFKAKEFFKPILEQGNDIIHIGFSSALSGTYDQISLAAKELQAEYPDRKITVIDSLGASFTEGLLVYYVLEKRNSGASYDEIVNYTMEMRDHSFAYFCIDDLNHLCRTGRATPASAFMGTALHIKPILYVNKLGKLIPVQKVISRKKAIKTMLDMMKTKMLPVEEQKLVAVGHSDCREDAELLANKIKEDLNIKNVIIFDVGPVIGTHVGAGMITIMYMAKDKIESNDPDFTK